MFEVRKTLRSLRREAAELWRGKGPGGQVDDALMTLGATALAGAIRMRLARGHASVVRALSIICRHIGELFRSVAEVGGTTRRGLRTVRQRGGLVLRGHRSVRRRRQRWPTAHLEV